MITRVTPVLVVHDVEPCAQFWQKLGFERVAEVPHEDTLGFVILVGNGIELMYQSVASVKADHAAHEEPTAGGMSLFAEVDDLDATAKLVEGAPIAIPERTTFYGMREIGVMDPGGNLVMFAQKTGG
jgi:catechol 2,3-dioxygenase-like lactoylglutathione lyase family enzyme